MGLFWLVLSIGLVSAREGAQLSDAMNQLTPLPTGYAVEIVASPAADKDGIFTTSFKVTFPSGKAYLIDLYRKADSAPHGWEATQADTTNESGYYSSGGLSFHGVTCEDYDGVSFMPRCVCAVLRSLGYLVSDNCLAQPL